MVWNYDNFVDNRLFYIGGIKMNLIYGWQGIIVGYINVFLSLYILTKIMYNIPKKLKTKNRRNKIVNNLIN